MAYNSHLLGSDVPQRQEIIDALTDYPELRRALLNDHRLLEAVWDIAPSGMVITTLDRKFLFVSKTFSSIIGYTAEELIGQSTALVFANQAEFYHHARPLLIDPAHTTERYEFVMRRKDGSTLPALMYRRVVLDDNDIPLAYVGAAYDISEIVQIVGENSRIFDQSFDMIGIATASGQFERLSRAWETVLGYPLHELIGKSVFELVHPHDLAPTQDLYKTSQHTTSQSHRDFEVRLRCADGTYRWLSCNINFYADEQRFYFSVRDIHQQRINQQAQQALYAIANDYHMSFDEQFRAMLQLGVNYLSLETGFFGKIDNEDYVMLGVVSPNHRLMPELIIPAHLTCCVQVNNQREMVAFHDRLQSSYKDYRVHEVWGKVESYIGLPLMIDDQNLGVVAFLSSTAHAPFTTSEIEFMWTLANAFGTILVRKYTQDAIEQQVQERTADLQLANTELDAFAHTVAHDLKNPLSAILNAAELLIEDPQDSDGPYYLNAIQNMAHKMVTIIDELLLLASVRRQADLPLGMVPMHNPLNGACQRLSLLIEKRSAELHIPANLPAAYANRTWVEEVWLNYLSNAIQYGGNPPVVMLGADRQGMMVRYWVRDNGRGIADTSGIFDLAEATQKPPNSKGHGLGLSIVQRLVARMGGQVGVESIADQGATFWFTLPALAPH